MPKNNLSIPGGTLFYQTFGTSDNPLLVLHGGPGLGSNYLLPQLSALGQFSFAIFYDQRGTGNSTSTNDWQSTPFETYCEDIEKLRHSLGYKKISLLGHSFGGVFASLYAITYPEHIDKLIYLNTVPLSSQAYLEFVKHRSQIVDQNKSKLDAIRKTSDFTPSSIYKIIQNCGHFSYIDQPEITFSEIKYFLNS